MKKKRNLTLIIGAVLTAFMLLFLLIGFSIHRTTRMQ